MFYNETDYRDRIYPDPGRGAGSAYWFHTMYDFMGGDVLDHYNAWVPLLKADFPDARAFCRYLSEECVLKINNTVVPGYYTIDYRYGDAHLYFNAANNEPPRSNGQLPEYEYPYAYRSPYICGEYGKDIITVSKGSRKLVLDSGE